MSAGRQVRPGRAERLRLRRRLDTATRGAALLDRKLSVLRDEHRRLLAQEHTARRAWLEAVAEAERWLSRGLLIGGERGLEAAALGDRARLSLTWSSTMGVRLPTVTGYRDAQRQDTEAPPANSGLLQAEAAYRTAARAAAVYAAAQAAVRLLGAETRRTRHRVRALRRHWIPRLSAELAQVELALEQAEQEDGVRRRWAEGGTSGSAPP